MTNCLKCKKIKVIKPCAAALQAETKTLNKTRWSLFLGITLPECVKDRSPTETAVALRNDARPSAEVAQ
jgi:hypothetical protein